MRSKKYSSGARRMTELGKKQTQIWWTPSDYAIVAELAKESRLAVTECVRRLALEAAAIYKEHGKRVGWNYVLTFRR